MINHQYFYLWDKTKIKTMVLFKRKIEKNSIIKSQDICPEFMTTKLNSN